MLKLVTSGRVGTQSVPSAESATLPRGRDLGHPAQNSGFDSAAKPKLEACASKSNPLLTGNTARSRMYEGLSGEKKEKLLAAIEKSREAVVSTYGTRAFEAAVNALLEAHEFTSRS